MRTFVISDVHGCPELIQNALRHGGFEPGSDGFVFAGDLLDRGQDADGCIALVQRHATEVLLGNHDVAALLGFYVFPQNQDSPSFQPFLLEKVLSRERVKAWKVATSVEGVLISHAGVSDAYSSIFETECASDPRRLADRLNREFRKLVQQRSRLADWCDNHLLGDSGPLWFRPWPYSSLRPLPRCTQVAGHTLPLGHLEGSRFHMIDPTSFEECEDPGRYRYAVIEEGSVRVEEGTIASGEARVTSESSAAALCA